MADPDLTGDIAEARDILEPYATKLKGLLQMWNMFESARIISAEFHQNFDDLADSLKLACTKGLVVGYTQPWSGNRNDFLEVLKDNPGAKPWRYPFMDAIVATHLHEGLYEARNTMVAHMQQGYEGVGVELRGGLYENKNPDPTRQKQDGTIDDAFVPLRVVVASKRGIWFLNNKAQLANIIKHIENAREAVAVEFRSIAKNFRDECLDHIHVIAQLTDLFTVMIIPQSAGNIHLPDHGVPTAPSTVPNPTPAQIGDINLDSYSTHYETTPLPDAGSEVEGKGYRLKFGDFDANDNLQIQVTFPKYPYPKIKPTS